jgi:hypothetical protein
MLSIGWRVPAGPAAGMLVRSGGLGPPAYLREDGGTIPLSRK